MCGIVAYTGPREAAPILLSGLKRLEYRGYDSAGLAVLGSAVKVIKTVGKVATLIAKSRQTRLPGTLGIAHTRWATHGRPTTQNAHPHTDCSGSVFLVHNGIIENYAELKKKLTASGHRFTSETDTEVLTHLVEEILNQQRKPDLAEAVRLALHQVLGTYGIAVISPKAPKTIVLARLGSPLAVGIGRGEYVGASDAAAIVSTTRKVIYLDDGELATLSPKGIAVRQLNGEPTRKPVHKIEWSPELIRKGGFAHFMHKEIHEQPEVMENTMRGRIMAKEGMVKLGGLEDVKDRLQKIDRLIISACGTAYLAGLIGKYLLEEEAGVPTEVDLASELRYRSPVYTQKTALLAISQSGETADTLAALRDAKRRGLLTLGIVNVVGSTIARETDAGVYNHAGPEIGVASTKAFISQLTVLIMLTIFLGRQRNMSAARAIELLRGLKAMPDYFKKVLGREDEIKTLARKYREATDFLYLGRKYLYPIALEGALKLKELSYKHAEGYAAGEMKHGPIAMIDEAFPTVALAPLNAVYEKMVSNIEEIRARGGPVIVFGTQGDRELPRLATDFMGLPAVPAPLQPLLFVLPLQLFAYHQAAQDGLDVDQPRNLAKSVTVE